MKEKSREKSKNKSRKNLQSGKKRDPLLNEIFFEKYKTVKKLGEGSFGKVYKAVYNGEYYALKFESRSRAKSLLEMEGTIMAYLQGPNIPFIKTYGYSGDYNLLVMQLMGKSLEEIFRIRKTFSIKTTAMIGFQLIGILHFIHDKNFIHRDVKPDNCVMGLDQLNENLYLIDFGLAKKYRSSRTLKQYPMTKKKRLTGTARYASIHALEGYDQSRRDDMESVGYIMAYLLRGGLPWQGLKLKSKDDKYKNILEKKKEISSKELFKGFPNEFPEILEYTKNLEYLQEPEYEMLRNKLISLCKRLNYKFDYIYDWTTDRDLAKRKNKKSINSLKNQSSSTRDITKSSKSKKKEKYVEQSIDDLLHKDKKDKEKKKEKNEKNEKQNNKEEKKNTGEDRENKNKKEDIKENNKKEENKTNDKKSSKEETPENDYKNNEIKEDREENKEDENEKEEKNNKSNKEKNGNENIENKNDDDSNNTEDKKGEDDEENKSKEEEDKESKSKTYSYEHDNSDKNDSKDNNSNGAEIDEEEPEVQGESTCCIV